MVQSIAETVLEVGTLVGLSELGFALLPDDYPELKKVQAAASVLIENGRLKAERIRYSPYFLKDMAWWIELGSDSIKDAADYFLRRITAHECYHFREAMQFPKRFQRTAKARKKEIIRGKSLDEVWGERSEYAAELFAYLYLQAKASGGKWQEILDRHLGTLSEIKEKMKSRGKPKRKH